MHAARPVHYRYPILAAVMLTGVWLMPPADGSWREMRAQLPEQTNAIVAINVAAVMRSPLAVKEGWSQKWADAYQAGPVAIIPGTQRVLAGAKVKPGLQEVDWRITMMELDQPVLMEDVARAQRGYPERMRDKMCVRAPAAYYVTLDDKTLGSYSPPDRQSVVRWLCGMLGKGPQSETLATLVAGMGASSQIVMAIEVADQYSAEGIRNAVEANPLSKVNAKMDIDKLANVLASTRYIVLQVDVTDKLDATAIVQLGTGADWFAANAKPVTAAVLDRAGISLPELERWTVKAEGKRVTLTGEMTKDSLANLLAVVGMKTTTRPVVTSDDPVVIAQTSRTFYRTVCASLDSYPKAGSYEQVNVWVRRELSKLENLPLVNVDPGLATWSAQITKKLREISLQLASDRQTTSAAMIAVQNPVQTSGGAAGRSSGYRGNGYSYSDRSNDAAMANQNRIARENAARQRLQILRQHQAESLKSIGQTMDSLSADRNAIRVKLVAKYKMEF